MEDNDQPATAPEPNLSLPVESPVPEASVSEPSLETPPPSITEPVTLPVTEPEIEPEASGDKPAVEQIAVDELTVAPTPVEASPAAITETIYIKPDMKALNRKAVAARRAKSEAELAKIIDFALTTERVTNNDVERLLKCKDTRAATALRELVKRGKLVRFGRSIGTFYKPVH
jgi:hypothetical protein